MSRFDLAAIAVLVLSGGVAATLATGIVQLRRVPGPVRGSGPEAELGRAHLALAVGVGSIAGPALALAAGGPGALAWMAAFALLGMALTYAEAALAVRLAASPGAPGYLRDAPLARLSVPLFGLAVSLAALLFGAAFPGQQVAQLVQASTDVRPLAVGIALALLAAALVAASRSAGRRALLRLAPATAAAYALLAALLLLSDPQAARAALERVVEGASDVDAVAGGAAGGSLLAALLHGAMWATVAGGAGLGTAALAPELRATADPARAGRAAMLAPLVGGIGIASLTGLLVLASGASPRRDIAERDPASGRALLLALERPHVRGLIPSRERGQVFVLPADTPLAANSRYPMVMRANPRGSQTGKLDAKQNAIAIPVWGISEAVDTIVFRSADPKRRDNPAYDRRVQVSQERRTLANNIPAIVLRPVDPEIDLSKLRRAMRGPYVQMSDFYFDGGVAEATHPEYGPHLAMFEDRPSGGPDNPPLRSIIEFGFRGPYFYEPGDTGRPPSGLIASEGFSAPVGTVLALRMDPPGRGSDLGSIVEGEYKTPGWAFLRGTTHALLRHDDPARDLVVPVEHQVGDDGTLRFVSAAPDIVDFARAGEMKEYDGPYLLPPPYEFEVEVHTSTRLDPRWHDRRVLVPIHELAEPQGGSGDLYDPHPGEVLLSDFEGPFLPREGTVVVGDAFERTGGRTAVLALAALLSLLALTSAAAWAAATGPVVGELLGGRAGRVFPFLLPAGLAAGALAGLERLLAVAVPLLLVVLAIDIAAVLSRLSRLRGPG